MTHRRVFTLLLLLFGTAASNTDVYSETNFGRSFVAFWPENVAHFYPSEPNNRIDVMALHDTTNVTIKSSNDQQSVILNAGESHYFEIEEKMELRRQNISNKTYQITSNLDIVAHVHSMKDHSMQMVLLIPNEKFGSKFFIPPVVSTVMNVTNEVTERNPIRLLCVSGDQGTTVTLMGSATRQMTLQPNEVAQIWLDSSDSVVKSDNPMGVYLTHPCLVQTDCTCGLLCTMLPPVKDQNLNFFIPSVLVGKAAEAFILKADGVQTQAEPFDEASPQVDSKGPAFLHRQGLLLPLIAQQDAAACYVVSGIEDLTNTVVIVVHKDTKAGVHVGSSTIAASDWQDLKGTDYVSAEVKITYGKNVIWHADGTMAVYLMTEWTGFHLGTPAPIISKISDFRGCAIKPEIIQVGDVVNGWRESLQYCRQQDMDLICFSSEEHRLYVNKWISKIYSGLTDLWIGMRRSSLTGAWYWVSGCLVVDTSWAEGEPGQVQDGQCVMMTMEEGQEFTWRDEVCCKAGHPVCSTTLMLFPI